MIKNYLEFVNEQKLHIQNGQDNIIKKEFPDYNRSKSEILAEAGNDNGNTFSGNFLVKIYNKGVYRFDNGKLVKVIVGSNHYYNTPGEEKESKTFENREIYSQKYTHNKYSVFCGKTEIARAYVGDEKDTVRILQGMPRTETIKKIIEDCPEYAKEYGLTPDYYPLLFGAKK